LPQFNGIAAVYHGLKVLLASTTV